MAQYAGVRTIGTWMRRSFSEARNACVGSKHPERILHDTFHVLLVHAEEYHLRTSLLHHFKNSLRFVARFAFPSFEAVDLRNVLPVQCRVGAITRHHGV